MKTPTLKPCEECQGTGETMIEKHDCDCPDCLGTGLEQPQRRIMQLECELAAKTEAFDRLNESLPKTKRLFTNALAETIINNQLKRIKLLEDELILAIKENL
jgi:uncharacterized coiled-coil protein SlyX